MRATVDEVGRVADAEGIDAHFAKGGTIVLARAAQGPAAEVARPALGPRRREVRLLGATRPRSGCGRPGPSARPTPPTAPPSIPRVWSAGWPTAVTGAGSTSTSGPRRSAIEPGVVRTGRGAVRAPYVVRATEGFTPGCPGWRRASIPVYSLIIATEPLPASVWDEIGLAQRETFSDHRHLIIYGQRTADDRLVFGGRGAPYHLGSRIQPAFDRDPRVFAALHATLLDLFPVLRGTRFTHAWGGPLGHPARLVRLGRAGPRDRAGLGGWLRRRRRLRPPTWPAARSRDLILRARHRADRARPGSATGRPRWEPEPLRWLGINAGLRAMTLADAEEPLTGRPSVMARAMAPLLGS